ncbi:MAG TPA: hypothetical protein DCE18_03550 [Syntrophobacteraceae bacterium]|nr:hypothetical protein [Syntrophobacteraceae bacterium]
MRGQAGIESGLPEGCEQLRTSDQYRERGRRGICKQLLQLFPLEPRIEEFRQPDTLFGRDGCLMLSRPWRSIGQQGLGETIVVLLSLQDLSDLGRGYALGQSLLDLAHEGLKRKTGLLRGDEPAQQPAGVRSIPVLLVAVSQQAVHGRRGDARGLSRPDGAGELRFRRVILGRISVAAKYQQQHQRQGDLSKPSSHCRSQQTG